MLMYNYYSIDLFIRCSYTIRDIASIDKWICIIFIAQSFKYLKSCDRKDLQFVCFEKQDWKKKIKSLLFICERNKIKKKGKGEENKSLSFFFIYKHKFDSCPNSEKIEVNKKNDRLLIFNVNYLFKI